MAFNIQRFVVSSIWWCRNPQYALWHRLFEVHFEVTFALPPICQAPEFRANMPTSIMLNPCSSTIHTSDKQYIKWPWLNPYRENIVQIQLRNRSSHNVKYVGGNLATGVRQVVKGIINTILSNLWQYKRWHIETTHAQRVDMYLVSRSAQYAPTLSLSARRGFLSESDTELRLN